jgi:hypothetical protein
MGFAATFVVGEKTFWQMNLITAHVAVGSLILAFWTIHMLRCRRAFGEPFGQSAEKQTTGSRTDKNSIVSVSQPLTSS